MIFDYKGTEIFYKDEGIGSAVVLLHGFLEDHTMWDFIVPEISKNNRVVCIDLLGHGKTECVGTIHTMDEMAEAVVSVLNYLKIESFSVIGHSMGGYVALELAKKNEDRILGLCLMNSTFEADDQERKELRARANEMIADNFESMIRVSFARLFSDYSKIEFRDEFEAALQIALNTSVQGYIAANTGMMKRKDHSEFFRDAPFKKAILLGKKDVILNYKSLKKYAQQHQINISLYSEGHMSYIENKTELFFSIMHFVEYI